MARVFEVAPSCLGSVVSSARPAQEQELISSTKHLDLSQAWEASHISHLTYYIHNRHAKHSRYCFFISVKFSRTY